MNEQLWIVPRNWERFQHYQDRWPAWIKFYPDLLHDHAFMNLPVGTRLVLLNIWLLFANSHGRVTVDTRWLSQKFNQKVTKQQLESLNHAGFIEFLSRDALDKLYPSSSPRALARGDTPKGVSPKKDGRRRGGGAPAQEEEYPPGYDKHGPTYPKYDGPRYPVGPMPWETPEVEAEKAKYG